MKYQVVWTIGRYSKHMSCRSYQAAKAYAQVLTLKGAKKVNIRFMG